MTPVDPIWSLESLLRDYQPHASWYDVFSSAYTQSMESTNPEERLGGWQSAAVIFGDMHANVLCLFVSYYGRTLVPPDDNSFLFNIDICLSDMGLAKPVGTNPHVWRATDLGKSDRFHRDQEAADSWMAEQLRPFDGDAERAAKFAMRLTAVHLGMLRGPSNPTIADLETQSSWERLDRT